MPGKNDKRSVAQGRLPDLSRNRDFMLIWSGQTVSALRCSVSGIAFPLLILALTHSSAQAGVAGALRALPYVLLAVLRAFYAVAPRHRDPRHHYR